MFNSLTSSVSISIILHTEVSEIKTQKLKISLKEYAVMHDIVESKFLQHLRKSGCLPDFIALKWHVVMPSCASFFVADLKI